MATGAWRGGGASGSRRELEDVDQAEADPFSAKELARWPEVRSINRFAVVRAYILVGMRGVGTLALLWATVVLLGGFVSTLSKKDFWYITFISFAQAAGMFDVVVDNPFFNSGKWLTFFTINLKLRPTSSERGTALHHFLHGTKILFSFVLIALTTMLILAPIAVFAVYAPLVCAAISLARLRDKDYGSAKGDASNPNLKPALDLFYCVCCAQGLIYLLFVLAENYGSSELPEIIRQKNGFSSEVVSQYITATKLKYANNLKYSDEWNFIAYGTGLLDSDMPEDNTSGARVLTMLIEQGMQIRRVLIRSPRQRIDKLIGALAWKSSADREMRWLAARIVEHLARDLNLDQFPGALECISTLLVTPGNYSSGSDETDLHGGLNNKKRGKKSSENSNRRSKKQESDASPHPNLGKGSHEEDLIVHGLGILENLAHDERNCTVITSSKGLFSKIIAPVSSDNFVEGIQLNAAWIKVVDASLKVLIRLMSCPGQEMHVHIADAGINTVRNLEAVLGMDMKINSGMIELQTRSIEVLTQLVLHQPATTSCSFRGGNHPAREKLIKKTLDIFLTDHWMENYLKDEKLKLDKETTASQEQEETLPRASTMNAFRRLATIGLKKAKMERQATKAQAKARAEKTMKEAQQSASRLKEKAGEALAMLFKGESPNSNSEAISSFAGAGCEQDVVRRLTEILDSDIKTIKCRISDETETIEVEIDIGCRISAAVILKHLSNHLNEPTLRKVLAQLLPIQVEASSFTARWWECATCWTAANKNDEENPKNPIYQGDQHQQPSAPQGNSRHQKSKERMLQAELLSLVAATCESSNLSFASLLLLPQPGALDDVVVRLKKMVEENWYATPACLAVLKFTCKMVMELIPIDRNAEVMEKHDIVGTLLVASETMARLESSMLFAGVDRDCYGVPLKPLSSALAKEVQDLLTSRKNELGIDAPAAGGP